MKTYEIDDGAPCNGPGIYLVIGSHTWGVKPMEFRNFECIPDEWLRQFPPLKEFVERFPDHWKRHELMGMYSGAEFRQDAVYWSRREEATPARS